MPAIKRVCRSSALILIILAVMGCAIGPGQQQTKLTYNLPTTISLTMGSALPATNIRYERMADEGVYVTIQGQQALKRKGDSLDWSGTPTAGVSVKLSQRIVWYNEREMQLVGTARITIDGVQPRAMPVNTILPIHYSGAVAYNMAKGGRIPGSTLTFEGRAEEGARLGGIDGYPYRKVGDSVFWEGMLRDGVYLKLDLRVVQFDDRGMRLAGIANLWIAA